MTPPTGDAVTRLVDSIRDVILCDPLSGGWTFSTDELTNRIRHGIATSGVVVVDRAEAQETIAGVVNDRWYFEPKEEAWELADSILTALTEPGERRDGEGG